MSLFSGVVEEIAKDAADDSAEYSAESCFHYAEGICIASILQLIATTVTFLVGMSLLDGWVVSLLSATPGVGYTWWKLLGSGKKTETINLVVSLAASSIPMYWLFVGVVYVGALVTEYSEPFFLNLVT